MPFTHAWPHAILTLGKDEMVTLTYGTCHPQNSTKCHVNWGTCHPEDSTRFDIIKG